jgi:hypothetical protein
MSTDQQTDDNVVAFPGAAPLPAPSPLDHAATALARELYCIAHGLAELPPEFAATARVKQIEARLAGELSAGLQAALGWAGCTLYLSQMREAVKQLVARAEVHVPSRGRHNERVLVYADRLEVLADLIEVEPKGSVEAAAWWKEREAELVTLDELKALVARLEKDMGGAPEGAEGHPPLAKIEGIVTGLLSVVARQKLIIERQAASRKQVK